MTQPAVLAFVGVSVAGGLVGSVVIPAGSVTTLGLGTTTTATAADDEPNQRGLLLEDLIGRLRNP